MNIQEARASKSVRLWVIGGLLVIVALLFLFFAKTTWMKVLLGVVFALLAAAFGLEVANTDFDMQKLVETGSFAASKIERDESGNLKPESIDAFCTAQQQDYNCKDFKNQGEAQSVHDRCKGLGRNMDVYGLDGDKDGTVCEALPKGVR